MTLRLQGSTSGYSEIDAPAVAGDQVFTLPGTGGTLDRLNRAGNVLQVVEATLGSTYTNTTNTYTDVGLSVSITPTSSSNKVLVLMNLNMQASRNASFNIYGYLNLLKNNAALYDFGIVLGKKAAVSSDGDILTQADILQMYLDSPASTSSLTYKIQSKLFPASSTPSLSIYSGSSRMYAIEIAG